MMLFKAPIQLPVHNKPLNANGKFFILSGCERQRLYECVSTTTTKKIKKIKLKKKRKRKRVCGTSC